MFPQRVLGPQRQAGQERAKSAGRPLFPPCNLCPRPLRRPKQIIGTCKMAQLVSPLPILVSAGGVLPPTLPLLAHEAASSKQNHKEKKRHGPLALKTQGVSIASSGPPWRESAHDKPESMHQQRPRLARRPAKGQPFATALCQHYFELWAHGAGLQWVRDTRCAALAACRLLRGGQAREPLFPRVGRQQTRE